MTGEATHRMTPLGLKLIPEIPPLWPDNTSFSSVSNSLQIYADPLLSETSDFPSTVNASEL